MQPNLRVRGRSAGGRLFDGDIWISTWRVGGGRTLARELWYARFGRTLARELWYARFGRTLARELWYARFGRTLARELWYARFGRTLACESCQCAGMVPRDGPVGVARAGDGPGRAAVAVAGQVIGGSQCGRDRPGYGCPAVYSKLRSIQYYRVLNIINLNYILFYNVL